MTQGSIIRQQWLLFVIKGAVFDRPLIIHNSLSLTFGWPVSEIGGLVAIGVNSLGTNP